MAQLARILDAGGQSDYHELSTHGGTLMFQVRLAGVPEVLPIWATHQATMTEGGRAVFKSICGWGYARRAAHELPGLGSCWEAPVGNAVRDLGMVIRARSASKWVLTA